MAETALTDWAALEEDGLAALAAAAGEPALLAWKSRFLGDRGRVTAAMAGIRHVPKEARAAFGQEANRVKLLLETEYSVKLEAAQEAAMVAGLSADPLDVTLPGRPRPRVYCTPRRKSCARSPPSAPTWGSRSTGRARSSRTSSTSGC